MSGRQLSRTPAPAPPVQAKTEDAPSGGGSMSLDPHAVQGRPGQFAQQYSGLGVQLKRDEADPHVGDPEGETATAREVPMNGETAAVLTKSGNLHLREEPSMDGKVLDKCPAGTVVTQHAKKGEWVKVKVWSGSGGKAGWMHGKYLKTQPGLTLKKDGDDKGNPQDYTYAEAKGKPFLGKPTVDQAKQGAIGDCYLIAAMGALAASPGGAKALMDMVHPHSEAAEYTVTFKKEQRDGSYKSESVKVDAWQPVSGGKLKYALSGTPVGDMSKVALWPAIIEKGYAQWKGGYEAIGGGGSPGGAMSEMAGVDVSNKAVSWFSKDEDLVAAIKGNVEKGKSMTAATKSKLGQKKESAFSGSGAGPYTASLNNVVVERSVKVTDSKGKAPTVTDDGKGKLTGAGGKAEGTIDYKKGKFSLKFTDGAPEKAGDLVLECQVKYWLSRSPDIVANHAYVVKGATADGIDIHNPWGSYHPGKVDFKKFRETYQSFSEADTDGLVTA